MVVAVDETLTELAGYEGHEEWLGAGKDGRAFHPGMAGNGGSVTPVIKKAVTWQGRWHMRQSVSLWTWKDRLS
ncbi:MAG TPA: hypothetical protein GX693_04740 [Firmicutes bacterium]|nr:hypothetical protein [Bacillota bacterium]